MAGPYVIGVDGGTEGLRAGVFDLTGAPRAFAAAVYETTFPQPGWAEQNPADWWQAMGAAVRQAVAEAGITADAVAGIALDTTCCSVVSFLLFFVFILFFFFNDTATTEIYTLSLHDALPISCRNRAAAGQGTGAIYPAAPINR